MKDGNAVEGGRQIMRESDTPCDYFPTTHWTLVGRAGRGDGEEKRKALSQLLQRYMPALRAHLIYLKHIQAERADDLLQDFLLNKIIEREILRQADPARGRFRSFLLTSLNRFIISEYRRDHTRKRSADQGVPIDENLDAGAKNHSPRNAFDVAWARQLLDQTIVRMEQFCRQSGRMDLWGVFEGRLLGPLLKDAEAMPYEQLVQQFGFGSPEQASNALVTARRMFVRLLRETISEYELDSAGIDAEIADLRRILSCEND
jgi:DNA-directed RNA polymerase specialized sigma24 family protein